MQQPYICAPDSFQSEVYILEVFHCTLCTHAKYTKFTALPIQNYFWTPYFPKNKYLVKRLFKILHPRDTASGVTILGILQTYPWQRSKISFSQSVSSTIDGNKMSNLSCFWPILINCVIIKCTSNLESEITLTSCRTEDFFDNPPVNMQV